MISHDRTVDFQSRSPWVPGLAEHLAAKKWESLREDFALSERSYNTGFFLHGREGDKKQMVDRFTSSSSDGRISVEFLSEFSQSVLSQHALSFYSRKDFNLYNLEAKVFAGLNNIALVRTLHNSVTHLARKIVLLRPCDDFSDTSYSSPAVPFTIFVSIPQFEVQNLGLRVAESIIHECMHLQLSLLEERFPLVSASKDEHYSPWKATRRSASGILHALYVFTVIREWIRVLPPNVQCEYLRGRSEQIAEEIGAIRGIAKSQGLTDRGRRMAKYLIDYLPTEGAI